MTTYRFRRALIGAAWRDDICLRIGADGRIAAIGEAAADAIPIEGVALPGMANVHSHAFQRAMAGQAEKGGGKADFWSWRARMYRLVETLTPEDAGVIAEQLYSEMLAAGYTAVGEFHYLHHDPEGRPYAPPTEMAQALIGAAARTGIRLVLLPVLYMTGGFETPAQAEQRRFLHTADSYLALLEDLKAMQQHADFDLGIAFHSLRAVPGDVLKDVLASASHSLPGAPVHIHAAEQRAEVEDCLAHTGARPVAWLLDTVGLDRRWCLVHATHMTGDETDALARSGAVAGLCPTTEANLGDGLFPCRRFLAAGGDFAIGSDSHVSIDAAGELRLLDYGQRLRHERRSIAADDGQPHSGTALWARAAAGGAQALGLDGGELAVGRRADIAVAPLDPRFPGSRSGGTFLDELIFARPPPAFTELFVGGRRIDPSGRAERAAAEARYADLVGRLFAGD